MSFQEEERSNRLSVKVSTNLLCEYTLNPLGIDVTQPRFSWVLDHSQRGQFQSAYQVLVASKRENLDADNGDKWDSGKVISGQSIGVLYTGSSLESENTYYWKLRFWDRDEKVSSWSKIATFEMGLLKPKDWKGEWIKGGNLLRKEFTVDKDFKRARAYVCGLGYYELRVNGEKVSNHVLDPGWTDYDKRALYVTHDITNCLKRGENTVGVMLGNGRYSPLEETVKKSSNPLKKYGNSPVLLLQIRIEFTNGSSMRVVTDRNWKVTQGPIVKDDIYNGETYDARLERVDWDAPHFDDSDWDAATVADAPGGKLVSQTSFPPVKVVKRMEPVEITNPKPNMYIYDFRQNFSGWVRLRVRGPRGSQVQLRYAELLDENGMINILPNQGAKAADTYILKGRGGEIYEPRFTYHGFRYVEVTGFPGTPMLDSLEGRVAYSAVEPVGGFVCSNSLANRIHQNVLWGEVSNLMSVPTDCPQRDERMGWMGDAQLTVEEAIYNFGMAGFYTKWVKDINDSQAEDGSVPDVVPPYWSKYPADPAWGTACIVIPWYLYQYYGDKRILEENYSPMKKWVDFLSTKAENHILSYFKYGDWCPPAHIKPVETPGEITSTWYYYHDTLILSKIAHILGRADKAKKYSQLSSKIKEVFNKKFLLDDHYATGSQACNVLPLFLDMVPKDKEQAVLKNLIDDILVTHAGHLNTGIVATRYILDVLTRHNQANLAYKLVTQTTYPGWGYMIQEGATTIWERWEYLAGGGMNSHNHIMFGSVDAWFYKVLAGINLDPAAPGFQRIIIKPYVVGDLKYVSASVKTIRGIVSSSWVSQDKSLVLNVTLPFNSQAKVHIPKMGLKKVTVEEGEKTIWENGSYIAGVAGVTEGNEKEAYVKFEVGSGSYSFKLTGT